MGNMHVSAMQAFLSFIRAFEWRSKLDNWGGGGGGRGRAIFIYSCSALLISFEINCF